jgi:8-oxo-dGTP pyrophosphatase MutT (NUDIX family)
VIDESWYVKPASGAKERTSAGGIIFRHDEPTGRRFLALTRGEGTIESYILPKGGVDPGESIEEAARREIEEEAGFSDLTLIKPLGIFERLSFDRRRWITTHYFLFQTRQTDPRPTDPNFPYVTDWFPTDAPLPSLFWPEQEALVRAWLDE